MALIYSTHTPLARHILPISFWTSISLVVVLFYLQLLYGISVILRPFWPSRYGSRPFNKATKRTETRVIDIILEILPPPVYRSPVPSSAYVHEDSSSHRFTTSHCAPHLGFHRVRSALPRVVELADMPQVYHPGTARGHESPSLHRENERPDNRAEHTGPLPNVHGMHAHLGFSHYDGTGNKFIPSTSCPNIPLATGDDLHVPSAPPPTPVQPLQELEEKHRIVELVHNIPIEPTEIKAIGTSKPNIKSATASTDEPKTSLDVIPPSSSRYTDNSTELSLSTDRNTKSRSTESYPGKFPVSEGLEYSSLATASSAFREKGTTYVRPFSDY